MWGQWTALVALPFSFALSTFWLVGFVPTAFEMIFELRGVVFKLADALLLLLVGCTLARLINSPEYRTQLWRTTSSLRSQGGLWAGVLLVGWIVIGMIWSVAPALVVYQGVYTAVLVLLIVLLGDGTVRLHWILMSLLVGGCLQSLIALGQWFAGGSLGLSWLGEGYFQGSRPQGLTFNPNTLASYLMLVVALTPALWTYFPARAYRVLLLGGSGLCLIALFLTGSRAPLLALLMAAAFSLLLYYRPHPLRPPFLIATALLLVGIYIILTRRSPLDPQSLLDRLGFAWSGTVAVLQSSPLFGVGAGQVMLRLDQMVNAETLPYYDLQVGGLLQPAHNAYLNLLAELGLPGLIGLGILVFPPLRGLFHAQNLVRRALSAALLLVMLVMVTEFHFWLDPHWRLVLFWLIGLWWAEPQAESLNREPYRSTGH
ncbi:MAG: O-antigen ligase family protein [Anaerolineae bacterium]|nr:O-antigen ligase family protein [Anaerolineae bacterium]